jgi:hypothetical protein
VHQFLPFTLPRPNFTISYGVNLVAFSDSKPRPTLTLAPWDREGTLTTFDALIATINTYRKYFSLFFKKANFQVLHLSLRSEVMKEVKAVWVLISKVTELTGYTDDAIRAKKKRGEWIEGMHWRKAPDNRIVFDMVLINRWMGS